ncbi:MAG TPA: hypothetical protein VGK30_07375 [Candidatus Binatia bacterium]|jgi:hypothetical protein
MRGPWLSLLCLFVISSAPAAATEYFVDFDATPGSACSDAGPGTDPRIGGTPWCTLPGTRTTTNTAFLPGPWVRISPGDVVSIKAGATYSSARGGVVLVDPSHYDSGTADARVVVRKHPTWGSGPYASLDGAGMTARYAGLIGDLGIDYVTFDGLEIANAPDYGFQLDNDADHVIVDHVFVHDARTTASSVFLTGCTTTPCLNIVRNSIVANAELGGGIIAYHNPGGHVLIQGNVVHHVCGGSGSWDGIQCGARDGTTNYCAVIGNVVYAHGSHSGYASCPGAGSDPIDAAGTGCHHNALVDGNVVYDSGGDFKVHGTYEDNCSEALESYAIVRRNRLTNEQIVSYSFPNDTVFYNNTLYNPGIPVNVQVFSIEPDSPPGASSGTPGHLARAAALGRDVDFGRFTFKNNIMWGQTSYHVLINGISGYRQDVRYSSMRFYAELYNVLHAMLWYPNEAAQDPTYYASWNAYLAARAVDPPDTGSILTSASAAATFVDAASRDYRLVAGSPAVDAGVPVTRAVGDSNANGSVVLVVERASFVDGYGGLFEPDHVTVGDCADVAIVTVDDEHATIVLASPCRWHDGDPVNLAYQGTAPDIGAFELGAAPTPTPTPVAPTATNASTPVVAPTATPIPEAGCPPIPLGGCTLPIAPGKAALQLADNVKDAEDTFAWTWTRGGVTAKSEFGDPVAADDYRLCVYDGSGLALAAAIPAGGTCGRNPCWQETRAGFRYQSSARTPNGIASVQLKQGLKPGQARIAVRGKGPLLALPVPSSLVPPLTVQLQRANGGCWGSEFSAPLAGKSAKRLHGKSD